MAGKKYGLDLGTNSLRIFRPGQGIIADEHNMIALRRKKEITALGNDAYDMFERTLPTIQVIRPVRDGVIADIQNLNRITEGLLRKNAAQRGGMSGNTFYIAAPSDVTEVEKRAYFDLIAHSAFNTRNIFITEKPIACAIGARMNIKANRGMMIVDMGAGSTEISVITLGGIVSTRLMRMGGNTINDAIIRAVAEQHQLAIGYKTAEYLKTELGQAIPGNRRVMKAYGLDKISGMPSSCDVSGVLVYEAMKPYLTAVFRQIVSMIETLPHELAEDVRQDGIYFAGGGAALAEFDKLIRAVLKIRPMIPENPAICVAKGLGTMIEDPNDYRRSIISLKDAAI